MGSASLIKDNIAAPPRTRVKPRLVLINPVGKAKRQIHTLTFPLGIAKVAALTPDEFDVKLIDEDHDKYEFEDADLVGLTAPTMTAPRAYEIAAHFRKRGIPVILGGIHAFMRSEEALKYVDTIVLGEAETVWKQVLTDYLNGCLKRVYKGEFSDLKDMPPARREIFSKKYLIGTIETARGCPLDCDFCSVTTFNGGLYRRRPIPEVLDELEGIRQKVVFFVGDNLVGLSREDAERAIDLCKGIVKRRIKKWWFCQASINFGDNEEVLKWAAKSGCKKVLLGLETIHEKELSEVNKRFNTRYEYDRIFRRINKYGIAVVGSFIYGFDNETVESMREKMAFMLRGRIDAPHFTIMTPLPGTKIYDRVQEQGRLMHTNYPQDWERYDMNDLVLKLAKIDDETFLREMWLHIKKIYSTRALLLRACKTLIHTRRPVTAGFAFVANLNYRADWKAFLEKYKHLARQAP